MCTSGISIRSVHIELACMSSGWVSCVLRELLCSERRDESDMVSQYGVSVEELFKHFSSKYRREYRSTQIASFLKALSNLESISSSGLGQRVIVQT